MRQLIFTATPVGWCCSRSYSLYNGCSRVVQVRVSKRVLALRLHGLNCGPSGAAITLRLTSVLMYVALSFVTVVVSPDATSGGQCGPRPKGCFWECRILTGNGYSLRLVANILWECKLTGYLKSQTVYLACRHTHTCTWMLVIAKHVGSRWPLCWGWVQIPGFLTKADPVD